MRGSKKQYVVSAIAAALVIAALFWWPRDKLPSVKITADAWSVAEPVKMEAPKPILTDPLQSEPAPKEAIPVADIQATKTPFRSSGTQNNAGLYKKIVSEEFKAYLEFIAIAMASEPKPDGKPVDETALNYYKHTYKLSDEDFQKILEFSASVLQADRKFQAEGQKEICDDASQPRNIGELGVALNAFVAKVEENQEALARTAQLSIDPVFRELFNNLRSQPHREVTKADFPTLLAARNRGLETELKRFCSVPTVVEGAAAK